MSENSDYVADIVRAIVNSGEIENENWEEFSLVLVFENNDLSQAYGYAYDPDSAWEAIAVRPRLIRAEANAYREWLRGEGDKRATKMLFQFNRKSGRFNVDMEYDDPARWKVTPANVDAIIDELRPRLGG